MTVLVFGATGQVARELAARGTGMTFLSRAEADLSQPEACRSAILTAAPQAVFNAAAYTAVDKAEDEEALATRINGDAPGAMAEACRTLDIPFLHVSTDYVFDGSGSRPWSPEDLTAPLSAYGRSKLAGENAILASGATAAILRTSWVFSRHGSNFVKTMLRLGAERPSLRIVADQIGGPTPASAIADALIHMAGELSERRGATGLFHFSGAPDVSWADFARTIFREAELGCTVEDIPTANYPTPACRPLNSRLDCSRLQQTFGIARPDWRANLQEVLNEVAHA
ncbi:dTDP-4-dehydrorhamnose reductase [Algicella marina]|uniref:dTDP-4-dehydrorhamnose reductase n=1 Tax=Algicella marina TaxID=2683284 RepID=A0A6P1SWE9_9RHOB|nr:dTDP-4-dehydrorhamnose reductase [Algicella marina]QHQ34087.1 dTDP-4-dehydrorhamnose reductase [Algicella marina]